MNLTPTANLNENLLSFSEKKESKVKDTKIKYKRIQIETVYPNGKRGPLVNESSFLFSFGVTERKNQETGKLAGYDILFQYVYGRKIQLQTLMTNSFMTV